MKIGIIGGNGFIGDYFLSAYSNNYSSIKMLVRSPKKNHTPNINQIEGTLSDAIAIDKLTQDIDVLIHTGFDHTYSENIEGIYNIINNLNKNNVPRLVYISSFIVYDLLNKGTLNEQSPDSKFRDIYTVEKKKIEEVLQKHSVKFHTIILQPSIVYGIRGNWSSLFFKGAQSKELSLPQKGELIAPVVYISDVARAIYKSSLVSSSDLNSSCETFIISNDETVRWKDLYESHQKLLKSLNKSYASYQITYSYSGLLGNNFLKNTIIALLFTRLGHFFSNRILKRLKNNIKPKTSPFDVINNTVIHEHFALNGMPKLVHFFNTNIDLTKAKKILKFSPSITLEKGIEAMKKYYNGL